MNNGTKIDLYLAWFNIAKPIWLFLFAGYILFVIEVLLWLFFERTNVGAGGAMIVGSTIAAQTFFYRLPVREGFLGNEEKNLIYQARFNKPEFIAITEETSKGMGLLYKIAIKQDYVVPNKKEDLVLVQKLVLYRVDRVIEKFIAYSAIAGTLIWGYANELIKNA